MLFVSYEEWVQCIFRPRKKGSAVRRIFVGSGSHWLWLKHYLWVDTLISAPFSDTTAMTSVKISMMGREYWYIRLSPCSIWTRFSRCWDRKREVRLKIWKSPCNFVSCLHDSRPTWALPAARPVLRRCSYQQRWEENEDVPPLSYF